MNSNYNKGRRNEYRSMALLEAEGYYCIRAAGSHGLFDLYAVSASNLILCQVKSGNAKPSMVEIAAMKAFPVPPNCRKVVHLWRPRQKLPEINVI